MAAALPFISAAASIGGTVMSIMGQKQQANVAADLANRRAEQLRTQQVVLQQDIEQETEAEGLRRQLIARQGAQEEGITKVALASNGVLLEPGDTAFDLVQDVRDETRFKSALSAHRSEIMKRNLRIEADTIEGNIGAARLEAQQAKTAGNINAFSTALTGVSKFGSKFKFDGGFGFRTA